MKSRNKTRRLVWPLVLTAVATAFAAIPASPASAQGLFQALFGPRHSPVHSYAPSGAPSSSPFDPFGMFRDKEGAEKPRTPSASYCVRTCDGKFFPVSRGGKGDLSPEKVCNAMCPASKTKIFAGGEIKDSIATDGQRYSAMPNAFTYRERVVEGCTCNGRDPFGVVNVDIENDPTLRSGDVVVQPKGLTVFRGGKAPYKSSDFTPIGQSKMSPVLLKQLSAIKVLPNNPNAPFAMTVTVRQAPVAPEVIRPASATAPEQPRAETRVPPRVN